MKLKLCAYLLVAIGIEGTVNAGPVNLIDLQHGAGAGSFELLTAPFVESGPNYMWVYPGDPILTGWTIGGDGVEIEREPGVGASDGTYSIDLRSYQGAYGSVETSFATEVGNLYRLTFDAFGSTHPYPHSGQATVGDLVAQQFTPGNVSSPPTNPTYTSYSFDFAALSSDTALTFSLVSSEGFGPVIDNVSVYAIPEPATMGMIGLFACGLYFSRRFFSAV